MSGWDHAARALALLAIDPVGLGGAVVRMRAGPYRDAVLGLVQGATKRLPPVISDDQLFGGIDLAATLAAGRAVMARGFFDPERVTVLTMAERCAPELAAKLAQAVDDRRTRGLIALDEGAEPDEQCPEVLAERLAFRIAPEGRMPEGWPGAVDVPAGGVATITDDQIAELTVLAARFGINSMRAPLFAVAAARAHAVLEGRNAVAVEDLEAAAMLVYPHRATMVPEDEDPAPPPSPEPETQPDEAEAEGETQGLPDGDMLVDAVRALLPGGLLQGLGGAKARAAKGSGAGAKRVGNRRGRPLPPRPGKPGGRSRIDLVATLRTAAPWQPLRRQSAQAAKGLIVRPSDVRVKRFAEHSDRLLIFAVDASGSSAVSRLNEAKGAIELLLSEAYANRDHVALIAFRGVSADTLLPPTRSLVQTKRRLAALPGGGGTPLAAGLRDAGQLALQSRSKGLSPTVVLLTDGRANIDLDGQAGRAKAAEDADTVARVLRRDRVPGLVIDTGKRPAPSLAALSDLMDAPYIALPRADAHRLTQAVGLALGP